MNAHLAALAQDCLSAAFDKTMAFPQIVGTLIEAGFEGYLVDDRRNATTYFLPDGDSLLLQNRPSAGRVAAQFDQPGIAAQIGWGHRPIRPTIPILPSAIT